MLDGVQKITYIISHQFLLKTHIYLDHGFNTYSIVCNYNVDLKRHIAEHSQYLIKDGSTEIEKMKELDSFLRDQRNTQQKRKNRSNMLYCIAISNLSKPEGKC